MRLETNKRLIAIAALAITGITGVTLKLRSEQPSRPDRPPISGPAIPGASTEQEKISRQILLEGMLEENPHLQEWRSRLEKDTVIHINVYRQIRIGFVLSPIGVNVRDLPDSDGAIVAKPMSPGIPFASSFTIHIQSLTNKAGIWTQVRQVGVEPPLSTHFSVVDSFDGEGPSIGLLDFGDTAHERFIWNNDGSIVKIGDYEER